VQTKKTSTVFRISPSKTLKAIYIIKLNKIYFVIDLDQLKNSPAAHDSTKPFLSSIKSIGAHRRRGGRPAEIFARGNQAGERLIVVILGRREAAGPESIRHSAGAMDSGLAA
jgi:hypothetical protein